MQSAKCWLCLWPGETCEGLVSCSFFIHRRTFRVRLDHETMLSTIRLLSGIVYANSGLVCCVWRRMYGLPLHRRLAVLLRTAVLVEWWRCCQHKCVRRVAECSFANCCASPNTCFFLRRTASGSATCLSLHRRAHCITTPASCVATLDSTEQRQEGACWCRDYRTARDCCDCSLEYSLSRVALRKNLKRNA